VKRSSVNTALTRTGTKEMKGGRRRRSRSRSRVGTGISGGRRRRRRMGRGKAWDWIKGAAGKVNNFLKSSKLVSKLAPVAASMLPGQAGNLATKVGTFAASHGYGRRRRRRHGRGPYNFGVPPFSAGRGFGGRRRRRRFGRGTPGMGMTDPTTYPISTSLAAPRF